MIRSFVAVHIPEELRGEIRRVQGLLKPSGPDVKWVRPENVHLTLVFLGDVPEAVIPPLGEALDKALAGSGAPELTAAGLGVFPNARRPRVVWLGLGGDLAGLVRLQEATEKVSAGFGFEPEKRAFQPHLTLGRVRPDRAPGGLMGVLEKTDVKPFRFSAAEVILFRSDLKPSGAVYTSLRAISLKS